MTTGELAVYSIRCRNGAQRTWLFGGEGTALRLTSGLGLVVRVAQHGVPVTLGVRVKEVGITERTYGTLGPEQVYVVPLDKIQGVWAESEEDTTVHCSLVLVNPGAMFTLEKV